MTPPPALIPAPADIRLGEGEYRITDSVTVSSDAAAVAASELLRRRLWDGARMRVMEGADGAAVRFVAAEGFGAEGYRLSVDAAGVSAAASEPGGFHAAVQTLLQLAGPSVYRPASAATAEVVLPFVEIDDRPAFAWRGLMLDVARHFLPLGDVLRIIETMAVHKLNVLHLHLTDDQGWRFEVKRYPRLTEVGSWRGGTQIGAADAEAPEDDRPHGGFYTQDELRTVVALAADRGITVVPEIDLPGHSQAAIAAYPELGVPGPDGAAPEVEVWRRFGVSTRILNAEESTVAFFRDVIDELLDVFPSEVIHLGGDECDVSAWRDDPRSQQLMRERGLSAENELRAWFMTQLAAHLASRGRRMLGWDEVLDADVPAGTVILAWRGDAGLHAGLARGLSVVRSPVDPLYFDYRQSDSPDEPVPIGVVNDLERVYAFEPVPADAAAADAPRIVGAQGNVWTEHVDTARGVEYLLWPRAAALAEVLWSGPGRDLGDFAARLAVHEQRLDALGVVHRAASGPPPWLRRPGVSARTQERAEAAAEVERLTRDLV